MSATSLAVIGSYTRKEGHVPDGSGVGLSTIVLDRATGLLNEVPSSVVGAEIEGTPSLVNPSFLVPVEDVVYAVRETGDEEGDQLVAYRVVCEEGKTKFQFAGAASTRGGVANCHITHHKLSNTNTPELLVSAYASGTLSRHQIRAAVADAEGGSSSSESPFVRPAAEVVYRFQGTGPNAARQEGSHIHHVACPPSTATAPAPAYYYSCDLGSDKVWCIPSTVVGPPQELEVTGSDKEHLALTTPPGYGPRHLVFHPDPSTNGLCFIVCELTSQLLVCNHEKKGQEKDVKCLKILQDLPTTQRPISNGPPNKGEAETTADASAASNPSAIVLHPEGRLLLIANRFVNTIAAFAVTPPASAPPGGSAAESTFEGSVTFLCEFDCGGLTTRDMTIDVHSNGNGDGQWLLVANQDSHNISCFDLGPLLDLIEKTEREQDGDGKWKLGSPEEIAAAMHSVAVLSVKSPSCIAFVSLTEKTSTE